MSLRHMLDGTRNDPVLWSVPGFCPSPFLLFCVPCIEDQGVVARPISMLEGGLRLFKVRDSRTLNKY